MSERCCGAVWCDVEFTREGIYGCPQYMSSSPTTNVRRGGVPQIFLGRKEVLAPPVGWSPRCRRSDCWVVGGACLLQVGGI